MAGQLSIHGPVAFGSLALIFLILGIALGRSCSPFVCPVGKHEFQAKVTVCNDGKAYSLVVLPESVMFESSTSTITYE